MALSMERLTETLGLIPARGSYPIAANTRIFKGSIVGLNSSGQAIVATTKATTSKVVGKASATYDNRTGSAMGGLASACLVEVEFGIFNWANGGASIDANDVGKLCYCADDQTVQLTSGGDTLQIAGMIVDFKAPSYGGTSVPYVWMSPVVPVFYDLLTILASTANGEGASLIGMDDAGNYFDTDNVEAALQQIIADLAAVTATHGANMIGFQDSGNKTIAATVDAALDALFVEGTSTLGVVDLPLSSFADADGDFAKFANAGADGLTITDAKAMCLRFNNAANPPKMIGGFNIPYDCDVTANIDLKFLVSKVGATNNAGNTTTITVEAFNQVDGLLADADLDYGGATDAVVPDAASKTLDTLTRTLALANLPVAGSRVSLTIKPTDGTLDTDDFCIHQIKAVYTRKLRTS
jgi:hypothetical protein